MRRFEERVQAWVEEFSDKRGLAVKILNSLNERLWAKAKRDGTADLQGEDGWKVLVSWTCLVLTAPLSRGSGPKKLSRM